MFDLLIEKGYLSSGCNNVAGVDEAGRGALAGPVVAACVEIDCIEKINKRLVGEVNDSKKLSAKKREELFELLSGSIKNIGVAIVGNKEVDSRNVLQASLKAMRESVLALNKKIDIVLVDGNREIVGLDVVQKTIVGGDGKVFCIAAASIIAKVTRDRLMKDYESVYPKYGFAQHKGYGTKKHMAMLEEYGACKIHRLSFGPVRRLIN